MVDSVALIERDVVTDTRLKTALSERETNLVCCVCPSVADVDELRHEWKNVLLHLPIRDDRRC